MKVQLAVVFALSLPAASFAQPATRTVPAPTAAHEARTVPTLVSGRARDRRRSRFVMSGRDFVRALRTAAALASQP